MVNGVVKNHVVKVCININKIRIHKLIINNKCYILYISVTIAQPEESSGLGTGIAIGAAIIVILLIVIALIVLHRNKVRPVKNTENIQAAESKEDQNAAVMSYSTLENNRRDLDMPQRATFNTFHPRSTQNNHNHTNNNNNNNNNVNHSNGNGNHKQSTGKLL